MAGSHRGFGQAHSHSPPQSSWIYHSIEPSRFITALISEVDVVQPANTPGRLAHIFKAGEVAENFVPGPKLRPAGVVSQGFPISACGSALKVINSYIQILAWLCQR
jgi:hypothetical protein